MRRVVLMLFLFSTYANGQPLQLDMDVFAERRAALMPQLAPGSAAILPCKPEYIRNGDVEYEYRQESNFYYLSGFEEPQSVMVLIPSAQRYKYVLFVRPRNRERETWQGFRAGTEGAMATFRADTAFVFSDFRKIITTLVPSAGTLYYTFGINPKIDEAIRELFLERPDGNNWTSMDLAPLLAEMRLIKHAGDWRMGFSKAIRISAQAHVEAIKAITSGMYEYQVQAIFESVYRRNGSPRNGYPCIIGSGPNSCILHYSENTRQMQDGEVLLMDCGAEYGYYSADITRTVPVSGKFTQEQRDIYQLVLDAQNAGIATVKPGIAKSLLDTVMNDVLGKGLVALGFIKDKKDSHIFTLHGFSHWLGMEVHDVGKYTIDGVSRPLTAGMVFTIEPGIYVRPDILAKLRELGYSDDDVATIRKRIEPYMNIGVRIEDDILVTADGCKNLSADAPREIDQIEALMKR